MPAYTSREVVLNAYPTGMPDPTIFSIEEKQVPAPADGEVVVRNHYFSVDPYMRGRMTGRTTYVAPFNIGQALNGGAVGVVVESRSPAYQPGDAVLSMYGWREMFTAPADHLQPVDSALQPLSLALGALGMTGMTAWIGLDLCSPQPGETVFISAAAGAVGSVAGQLARLKGCIVIGSAGTDEKVGYLLDELGFDAAFNYKNGPVAEQLAAAAPDGIDIYFDNVGGDHLEAAIGAMRVHGRIAACGSISLYNSTEPAAGPANMWMFVTRRLKLQGFLVSDHFHRTSDFLAEVGEQYLQGRLKVTETVVEGIDRAAEAFIGLFTGDNIGKMVVDVRPQTGD